VTVRQALGGDLVQALSSWDRWRKWTGPAPTLTVNTPRPKLIERPPAGSEWKRSRRSVGAVSRWVDARHGGNVGSYQSQKLDPSRPAPTAIASHRAWSPTEPRHITIAEAKIIQGFPEWFDVDVYWPIGNSVPPPMAEAVGRHVAALLATCPQRAGRRPRAPSPAR